MNISPVNFIKTNNTSFKSKNCSKTSSKPSYILPSSTQTMDLYNISLDNNLIKVGSKCTDAFRLTEDGKCYVYRNGKAVPANLALKTTGPDMEQTYIYVNGENVITLEKSKKKAF